MGRLEAYAMGNKPGLPCLMDLEMVLGYGMILLIVAFFRELLGEWSNLWI
jgi:Na+-transporting NADH:ubiquinone oxidoreductase subunit D